MFSDDEKVILGKLFQLYRNKLKTTVDEIEYADISAVSSFYNAINGEIIKNENFYNKYCQFFNHDFIRKENFEKWINNYLPRVFHAFDYYEEDKFEELYNEFIIELEDYKNSAIYHEYYLVLSSLFNYYLRNEYLRLEEVNDYLKLVEIKLFNDEFNLYLLDYMFRSNNNYIGNKELPDIIINKMEEINENHELTKYYKAAIFRYNNNFYSSLELCKECYEMAQNRKNSYRETRYLLTIYSVYRNIDEIKEEETATILLKLKTMNIPNNLKQDINYSVGMQDYLNGRYERGYELFSENITKYKSLNCLLFLCSICSRTNRKLPEELYNDEVETRYDYIYLDYFRKKQENLEDVNLVKYVLNTIVPNKLSLEIYRNPYWSLFEYEIHEMAQKDNKLRKYYLEFTKKMKKKCKDA